MTRWAIIPRKPGDGGKSRLANALSPAQRNDLINAMAGHVIQTACQAEHIDMTYLLCTAGLPLPDPAKELHDTGQGLNVALQRALAAALTDIEVSRIVIVAADLPLVTAADIDRLAAVPAGAVGIAPNRQGTGTNALSLPLPAAHRFQFGFGPDSLAHHAQEAARLGLGVEVVHSPGLARDVDLPEDLPDAALLSEHTRGMAQ